MNAAWLSLPFVAALVLLGSRPALADVHDLGHGVSALSPDEVPAAVRTLAACDLGDDVWRRPFRGAVLFAFRCPGNNQNDVVSFVRADDESGRGARRLLFPGETGSSSEIANVRLFHDTGTVGEIVVDGEHEPGRPCRSETLYRLDGWTPRRVFHRTSVQCDRTDEMKWHVTFDRRTEAERRDEWW